MFAACVSYAQKVDYGQRYEMLVSKFGPAGFGVETVLDNWAKADSADIKLLTARFKYYFAKAQTEQVVKKPQRKYLGMDPLITLKDSTGTDVYYYQEAMFDDEIYGQALKAADKAILMYPDYLDFRFIKANAYIAYEKESPDMALAYLVELAQVRWQGCRCPLFRRRNAGVLCQFLCYRWRKGFGSVSETVGEDECSAS